MIRTRGKEPITLLVDSSKKKAFLDAMKLYDFVSIETKEQRIKRYISSAPKTIDITDEEIMKEVKAVRKSSRK